MNILYSDGGKLKQRPGTLWVPAFFSSQKPEQTVYHISSLVPDRFVSFFEEDFLTQFLVKQELKQLYNTTYQQALTGDPHEFKNEQDYHDAQRNALQECFIQTQHFGIEAFDLSQPEEQKNAVTALNVRYQMLENPEFLEQVLQALNQEPDHAPVSMAESVAQSLKDVFLFEPEKQAAHFYALQQANAAVMSVYNNNAVLQNKIEMTKNACKNVLIMPVQSSVNLTGFLKEALPQIVLHFNALEKSLQQKFEPSLMNRAMKQGNEMVFRQAYENKPMPSPEPITSVNLPVMLKEYQNEIGLLLHNKVSLAKLRHDIEDLGNLSPNFGVEVDLNGKQSERLFYHISNEIIFESIALKERDKTLKHAIGNATGELLAQNENQLNEHRIAYALELLPELLPNCSKAYLEVVQKENAGVTYDEFLDNLKTSISYNRGALRISDKVDEFKYADKMVQALSLELQERELNGSVYYADYENHLTGVKQEMNAIRLAEYAKIAKEFSSIQTIFDYEVQDVKSWDQNLISQQEKKTILYHDVLNEYIGQLNNKMDTIASLYNTSQPKLESFSVSFVKGVTGQLAWEANPKISLSAITAYADVLEKNKVISSQNELQNIVEVLCKRENPLYEKIQSQLQRDTDAFSWNHMQQLPVLTPQTPQPKTSILTQKTQDELAQKPEKQVESPREEQKQTEQTKNEPEPLLTENQPQPVHLEEKPTKKSITQQFDDMKAVQIGLIDQDALTYVQRENDKQQLDEFELLSAKEQTQLLNRLQKTAGDLPVSGTLQEQAKTYLTALEDQNKEMLKKYGKCSDDEKIAFVVLALNKQDELPKNEEETQVVSEPTAKIYHLDDKKEFASCKNDLFWKMQLLAVKKNVALEETLNDETMTEFKQVAPVVKLFEIAASDHMGLSEVKIANIGQLNYQQLARVSILKFKDGKINDPATVNLINHILTNTSAYAKTQAYNQTLEDLLARSDVAQGLQNGTLSLDHLIEQESKDEGVLGSILNDFYKKTTPNLPKLIKTEENDVGNNNITI